MVRWLLALVLATTSLTACAGGATEADCAPPFLTTQQPVRGGWSSMDRMPPVTTVVPGQRLRIYGVLYAGGCSEGGPPPGPMSSMQILYIDPTGETESIADAHPGGADSDYSFALDVTIPEWATPGDALIQDRYQWDGYGIPLHIPGEPVAS